MSFPRYPAYKDSGVEWLGELPEHWDVWKLAHAFTQIGSGTTPKTDKREYYEGGVIPWVNTGDLNDGELHDCEKQVTELAVVDHSSLKTYPAGSLLIAMYGATIGRLGILSFAATVNQACCVFAGKSEITTKFMFYWFLGLRQQIISLATGGGQPNISQDILRSLRVACPSRPEQTQIATFLDHETAKIDALVAEQRRLMELLKEKRQAVISHAVTRGLNPAAPMKPSGIEWLGDVPAHWNVTPIGHLSEYLSYGFTNPMPTTDDGPYMLTANDVDYGRVKYDSARRTSIEAFSNDITDKSRPKKGDILITKDGTLGRVAIHEGQDACINQSVAVLRVKAEFLRPEYTASCLLGGLYQGRMIYDAGGTTIKHIYISRLAKMPIAFPSLAEQDQLLIFLKSELAKFETLTTEAQRAIDLLQERRTALISAAVTGQIDVRGHVQAL